MPAWWVVFDPIPLQRPRHGLRGHAALGGVEYIAGGAAGALGRGGCAVDGAEEHGAQGDGGGGEGEVVQAGGGDVGEGAGDVEVEG